MRKNIFTWGHVTWFRTSLRLRLITIGEVVYAQQGDLDPCYLVFLSESVAWTRLGYLLMNGSTLHLRVDVRCMNHTMHDWLDLWKSWRLVVKCMSNWWIIQYDYGYCYSFLAHYCHLMLVDFFYNKLTLAILYCVVGPYDDRKPSFVGADELQ